MSTGRGKSKQEGYNTSPMLLTTVAETHADYEEEQGPDAFSSPYHGNNRTHFTISAGLEAAAGRGNTTGADMLSPWDSPSSRPVSARSEPGYSVLRSFTTSPMMSHLSSGLAELQPIGDNSSALVQASPPPVFSLALATSPVPSPAISSRVSPRCGGASSRILYSPPCRSLRSPLSQSYSDHPRYSQLGESSSSLVSTSSDEYASTTTDNSSERMSFDSRRFSDEIPCPALSYSGTASSSSSTLFGTNPHSQSQQHLHHQPQWHIPSSPTVITGHTSSPSFGSRTLPIIPAGDSDRPHRANSDVNPARSRSRTLHSVDRHYCSGTSPTSPGNKQHADIFGQHEISSPTRSRGGNPNTVGQRTANFMSNPRPSINRQRRESISRPKPKLSGEGPTFPKEVPVGGLIPDIKPTPIVPPSPSRPQGRLPYFHKKGDVTCNRISNSTLVQLLSGQFAHVIPEFYIIDCRSAVEFAGGHIRGAVHAPTSLAVIERFITSQLEELPVCAPNVALIFHCEFSEIRSPACMLDFRDADRNLNPWPNMFYHDVYCLDGGYSKFYEKHISFCEPQGYVPEPGEREHKSGQPLRRSHSISRVPLSRSMGQLPSMDSVEGSDPLFTSCPSISKPPSSSSTWNVPFPREEDEDRDDQENSF